MKRIYHHWEKWECYKAGFYETVPPIGHDADSAKLAYMTFLADTPRFIAALERVISEWKHSCDQFLSNDSLNRIAWLGQASMCIETGIPSVFRGGFKMLTPRQQRFANSVAKTALDDWIKRAENRPIFRDLATPGLF